jgi:hypothetical protein
MMSYIKKNKWAALVCVVLACSTAYVYASMTRSELLSHLAGIGITYDGTTVTVSKAFTASGTNTLSGATTLSGAVTSTSTFQNTGNSQPIGTIALAASLTSPTVTFNAGNASVATLNSDANATGIYPTNGKVWQTVLIKSGAGSNTMRFDDGTSMTLGGNITLTEGQNDILTLVCTSADGDEWAAVSAHDN